MLAGFLAYWVTSPRYGAVCNAAWTLNATLYPDVYGCVTSAGVKMCCKMADEQFSIFKFFAFLSGNVIAGYKVVQYGAMCMMAKLVRDGQVEGGGVFLQRQASEDNLTIKFAEGVTKANDAMKKEHKNSWWRVPDITTRNEVLRISR